MLTRRQFLWQAGSALAATGFGSAGRPAPNLLLVFPDELRPDWTSFNPHLPIRTPNLARLAAEGTRFTRAYCPSPLCAPSRACLAQARPYGQTGVWSNQDNNPDGVGTFYQCLANQGYRVASVGKLDLRKGAFDWGPDGRHRAGARSYFGEWGFTDGCDSEGKGDGLAGYERLMRKGARRPELSGPYLRMLAERRDGSLETWLGWFRTWRKDQAPIFNYADTVPCDLPEAAYGDNWVGAQALELIQGGFSGGTPWFLQVNFPGPHFPMDITREMDEWYRGREFPQPVRNHQLPRETHQRIRRNYSAMVENVDRWLGRLLAALERRGELDRTLVVFSSDHGEMLGDLNRWTKNVPYEASCGVPLIIRGPGVAAGRVHAGPTTTLDLPATFLDFAGGTLPADRPSRSLRRVLAGDDRAGRSHVTAALGPWRMVCNGRYKLVQGFDPTTFHHPGAQPELAAAPGVPPLLFDLQEDPTEAINWAEHRPDLVAALDSRLPPVAPSLPPARSRGAG